ncbi:DUF3304 domain-containing protein [Metapseudomonas furukawaii]|uniref:DUF3304 domain-containing protein n=3 Tax=Metapseudomonas furukawaii TaxID=1149133 RepID=UPI000BBAC7DA|nr:DUF3304 domain-containing protein [Pseudomonas furukawaii]
MRAACVLNWLWGVLFLSLAGCSLGESEYLGGNLNGVNHTSAAINYFKVNGYGGPNISPHGYGGGMCCVMLPREWRPGLMMKVEWETDPDPYAKSPPLGTDEFRKFMVKHKANYEHHTAIVPLPPYEQGLCALEVHFLPCHQVKVTTACWGYGSPKNPIKEPLEMKEPAECPK